MKNYVWIVVLFTANHLYCPAGISNREEWDGEEAMLQQMKAQVENTNFEDQSTQENDPLKKTHGPDFFAQFYKKMSQKKELSDDDKNKYAQLANKVEQQMQNWRWSLMPRDNQDHNEDS